ncbi:MAG: discoidin domain-containing protein [Bacteroidia bacterium]|nr:discoidin domain-containing protein [Bacteroidia bacterium]
MKKALTVLIVLVLAFGHAYSQCDSTLIPKSGWSVSFVDSEELVGEGANNGHAIHCIDGDSLTHWHTQYQGASPGFPHEIHINLGAVHAVNGISLLSRSNGSNGKIKDYELFLSLDSITWASAQAAGVMVYPNLSASSQRGEVFFGAIDAQYLRLVANSNYQGNNFVVLAELDVFEYSGAGCIATGQINQTLSLVPVPKQATVNPPVILEDSASSGLPLTYSVISGPATVSGDTLTLNGIAGTVVVNISQAGDATYYPVSTNFSFDVIDLATYFPELTCKLAGAQPLQMSALRAYPIHSNASIAEPAFLSIDSVVYEINGTNYVATFMNNSYQLWWTPPAFGNYTFHVTAYASNGNTDTDTINLLVSNGATSQNIATIQNGVINFGSANSQSYTASFTLPQSLGVYDQIIANFDISCPNVSGGCDDWDRLAWLEVKGPDGDWKEVFRYITPYGVACNHSVDVTDYASLLQGNVEMRIYIETWGSGGWQFNLDFDYRAGTPTYVYTEVEEIWQGNYNFGNPLNLQPLDTVQVHFASNAQQAKFRLISTGHGWGDNNSLNAAEFYHTTHELKINNIQAFTQDLWMTCNPNPDGCSPQNGSWNFSRAGWCPGAMGKLYTYDLSPYINQAPFDFSYIFQPSYQDICHPNYPGCASGITCPDCNDGFNPFYRVGGYMISYSNTPIILDTKNGLRLEKDKQLTVYPNPGGGKLFLSIDGEIKDVVITVHDIKGETLKTYYFHDKSSMESYAFNFSSFAKGIYFIKLQTKEQNISTRFVIH